MKYEVIDNYLNEADFKKIENLMMGYHFPWYYQTNVAALKEGGNHYYLSHAFYGRHTANSTYLKELTPLLDKLDIKALIRVKGNFYPSTEKIKEHPLHTDYTYPHKSILYSINTNNGYTQFKNGKKINSVANRVIKFDASNEHQSSTCSDRHCRINIVVNYF